MTDEPELLQRILENPDEDTHRLTYADWLDEHDRPLDAAMERVLAEPDSDAHRLHYADACERAGQGDRAEFVRVQVKSEAMLTDTADLELGVLYEPVLRRAGAGLYVRASDLPSFKLLRGRARKLLSSFQTPPDSYPRPPGTRVSAVYAWAGVIGTMAELPAGEMAGYRRGFIESLTCTAADWLTHADAILARHPVRKVTLTSVPRFGGQNHGGVWLLDDPKAQVFRLPNPEPAHRELVMLVLDSRFPSVEFELPRFRIDLGTPQATVIVTSQV